ncbi:MAG: hypothetical protein H0W99_14185 [Acidobacteria bacterium]|jgi:hypothetical protein|nr:hypothetical protein [Acidobacteriota bacterium]
MTIKRGTTVDVDEDYLAELEETNAALTSRLDQITGISRVVGDDATDEQLQNALDEIFSLAAPEDDLADNESDDNEELELEDD